MPSLPPLTNRFPSALKSMAIAQSSCTFERYPDFPTGFPYPHRDALLRRRRDTLTAGVKHGPHEVSAYLCPCGETRRSVDSIAEFRSRRFGRAIPCRRNENRATRTRPRLWIGCPCSVPSSLLTRRWVSPDVAFQIRIRLSEPAEAICSPSGVNAIANTAPSC